MEVTALCVRLWMDVLVLLLAQANHSYFAQRAGAAFPRVRPDRLQFFEYETLSVNCEEFRGLTEWRVMRRLNRRSPTDSYNWSSSAPSSTIYPAFRTHSGEYWCEDGDGNSSSVVNITITDGSVILEVPARPVVEGDDVILHCSKRDSQSKHISDFYKDGSKLGIWYEKDMIIQNVSKSDEGLYKCSIAGAESPESWLTVSNQTEETPPSYSPPPDLPSLLWIIVSVSVMALLLLVMGLLLCKMHKILVCFSSGKPTPESHSPEDHTGGGSAGDPDLVTYAVVEIKKKRKERVVSGGCTELCSPDESVVYSSVHFRQLSSA
ncbi:Fc receptor-like protein 5 [Epinephelus fuscoguttatus]|uniref:Fc receptor-like protein 5 n=1 Tax=Epinephelus fuscoguttatus TaxID=293821 RepID=UPI0020D1A941|nr:Fc receptor-like protein 5 [Epinephelus fuscoguttatus]